MSYSKTSAATQRCIVVKRCKERGVSRFTVRLPGPVAVGAWAVVDGSGSAATAAQPVINSTAVASKGNGCDDIYLYLWDPDKLSSEIHVTRMAGYRWCPSHMLVSSRVGARKRSVAESE